MKIKQRLILSFGYIMIAAMIFSAIIFYTAARLRSENERAGLARAQLMILKDIRGGLNSMVKEVYDYVLTGENKDFTEYELSHNRLEKIMLRYEAITENEIAIVPPSEKEEESEEMEVVIRIKRDIGRVIYASDKVVDLSKKGGSKVSLDHLISTIDILYESGFAQLLDRQITDEEEEISVVNESLVSLTYRLQYITLSTLIIIILIIWTANKMVMRSIYKPIKSLVPAMEKIGKGDFNINITRIANNEIGVLAGSMNRMADELRSVNSQLVQSAKLASIGQLSAGVAHELNQPLMVIRLNAQMVLRQIKNGNIDYENTYESLKLIERNTGRMDRIIRHLRSFSRRTEGERDSVDINKVIEESFTMINEQLRIHSISVKMNLSSGLPLISGSANELEQVFINMILNSKDALLEDNINGSKEIEMKTALNQRGDQIIVTVKDTGSGIPPGTREEIFDPFHTTKPVGKGTGLGLSIAYGIVKDHNGTIELLETGPKGTTFLLLFPTKECVDGDN